MKAADITVDGFYAYSRFDDYMTSRAFVTKVKVLEAPAHPWKSVYRGRFGSQTIRGQVDTYGARRAARIEYLDENDRRYLSEDRVPLQHIREPWDEYEARMEKVEAMKADRQSRQKTEDAEIESLNQRLRALGAGFEVVAGSLRREFQLKFEADARADFARASQIVLRVIHDLELAADMAEAVEDGG